MAMTAVFTNFNGRLVHENRGGTERGYVPDPLGSTIALVDSTGAVTDTWEYWPYGEVEGHTGSSTTPFTFVGTLGYFRDLVSSLTYVRARFYQALIGQWMTRDWIWPKLTAYQYCHTNPTTIVDPLGLKPTFTTIPQFNPPDDYFFKYGRYCGMYNKDNSPCRPEPIDCIDSACREHDDCVDKCNSWWDLCSVNCHCKLANQARNCATYGCIGYHYRWRGMPDWRGHANGIISCISAADAAAGFFGLFCAVTSITGLGIGIGGLFDGGTGGTSGGGSGGIVPGGAVELAPGRIAWE